MRNPHHPAAAHTTDWSPHGARSRRVSGPIRFCPLTTEPLWEQVAQKDRVRLYLEGYRHVVDLGPESFEVLGEILPDGDVRLRSGHLWSEVEDVFGPDESLEVPAKVVDLSAFRERKAIATA